jgi:hypothetical protein
VNAICCVFLALKDSIFLAKIQTRFGGNGPLFLRRPSPLLKPLIPVLKRGEGAFQKTPPKILNLAEPKKVAFQAPSS